MSAAVARSVSAEIDTGCAVPWSGPIPRSAVPSRIAVPALMSVPSGDPHWALSWVLVGVLGEIVVGAPSWRR